VGACVLPPARPRHGLNPCRKLSRSPLAIDACFGFSTNKAYARTYLRRCIIEIFGHTTGLSPSDVRALERIYRRRVPADRITSPELTRSLVEASVATGRQVGALVHRSGAVESVIVGDATRLTLPDIGRLRASGGRFRGLRLVHTHLRGETVTHDDLVDLSRLRLDVVAALLVRPDGTAGDAYWAHLLPENAGGELWRIEGPVQAQRLDVDFAAMIRDLEGEFARISRARPVVGKDGRAVLVHVTDKRHASQVADSLRELRELARTAGVEVVDEVAQVRDQIDPRYVLGKGKLDEVMLRAMQRDADVLIFDRNLAPAQTSSIAAMTDLKVIDRTQLILDIFAQRAETRDGKLQVELAQLKYMLPRLGQRDDSLSRLTGGLGGRGPGETKLEVAGRRARDRITHLEAQLRELAQQRRQRRSRRAKSGALTAALIGYTNAGKSTLLNALTGAEVIAEDKLFATLDPRSRRLVLEPAPGAQGPEDAPKEVIVTDTVGFIRDLPKDLVAAFRATFEETADADLLLHVVDASDARYEDHIATTESLLEELDLASIPRVMVFNKADAAPLGVAAALARAYNGVAVSACDRSSLAPLVARLRATTRRARHDHDEGALPPWASAG
jgi:GTP-binding protein HflX